ncbi:MAG: hypothetical protein K6A92_09520, partial [Lachnospiraceae bacterium]|nr:hypothetical protein [Lachnospiraceae bacterium]
MDDRTSGFKRNSMHRVEAAVIAILVNVALSFLMRRLGLPIFLDSAGTIAVSIMGGFFPGIMTAVITNILCISFDTNSLYFTVVQAFLAIFISWFFKNRSFKRISNILAAIGGAALLSGVLSTFIQWGLFFRPELPAMEELVDALLDRTGYPMLPVFLFVNIVGNLLDKGLCMILAVMVVSLIPEKMRDSIRNSGWRQKPLTDEQVRSIHKWGEHLPHPIRNRITIMIAGISLALVVITAGIGTTLFFHLAKEDRTDNARNAAAFAADVVDPAMLDVYMAELDTVSGYAATQDLLDHIRRSAPYVDNLYVVKARDDGFHVIFASQNRLPAA